MVVSSPETFLEGAQKHHDHPGSGEAERGLGLHRLARLQRVRRRQRFHPRARARGRPPARLRTERSGADAERQNFTRDTSRPSSRTRCRLIRIQCSRSRYFGQSAPGSATAYRWRICSKLSGSIVSMTRCVSNWKRLGRSTLSVCFLALARLLPSTSFRILWRSCTAHTL